MKKKKKKQYAIFEFEDGNVHKLQTLWVMVSIPLNPSPQCLQQKEAMQEKSFQLSWKQN